MDTFDLGQVKVIMGPFNAVFSKLVCSSKTAHHRVKTEKIGPCGCM